MSLPHLSKAEFVRYEEECDPDEATYLKFGPNNSMMGWKVYHGIKSNLNGHIHLYRDFNVFEAEPTPIQDTWVQQTTSDNHTKRFLNPDRTLLCSDNLSYQNIEDKFQDYESYYIHDNGGRPFLVYVNPETKHVAIFKQNTDECYVSNENGIENWMYIQQIEDYNPMRIFIGKSPFNSMTEFSGGHGDKFDGNSILLHLFRTKYIYIGSEIFSFETENDIVDYVSHVGNSDVPYPYAVDVNGRHYMMLDKKIMDNVPKDHNDPYAYHYELTKDSNKKDETTSFKNVSIIQTRL